MIVLFASFALTAGLAAWRHYLRNYSLEIFFTVRYWFFIFFLCCRVTLFAQTNGAVRTDTGRVVVKKVVPHLIKKDSLGRPITAPVVRRDSLGRPIVSAPKVKRDSLGRVIVTPPKVKRDSLGRVIVAPPKIKRDSLGRPVAAAHKDSVPHSTVALPPGIVPAKKDSAAIAVVPGMTPSDSVAKASAPPPPAKPVYRPTASSLAYDSLMKSLNVTNKLMLSSKPRYYDMNPLRTYRDMDWLVYIMMLVTLALGIIRMVYQKYFTDLFRAFTNPTLSQRQLKDQLSQSPFPNFLLNVFFAISLGVYLFLVMYRQQYIPAANPLILIPVLILLVAVIYFVKYVVLRICGWLFGNEELVDAYVFILYLVNKITGVVLLPFLVVLAFCSPEIARFFLYISIFFIVLLIVYRYIRSYSLVKQYLSFSKLHFFLYLCAFEVAPVLILTKVLLKIVNG